MTFGSLLVSSSSYSVSSPPVPGPPLYSSPLILGPSLESRGGLGIWEEGETIPEMSVTPAEEGALFGLSDDTGAAAFPLPAT